MGVRWTSQEVDYLHSNIGLMSRNELAHRITALSGITRTPGAVKQKALQLKINAYNNIYSMSLLARELGVPVGTLKGWKNRGLIRGRQAGWRNGYFHPCFIIVEKDIVAFLRTHFWLFWNVKIPNLYFKNIVKEEMLHWIKTY